MVLPLYALTLFVSAFLLFLVQPMIGKMILPPLGGTPQVWNTCVVFFQTALLAGYAYTHTVSTRLSLRRQLMVHGFLLLIPLLVLLPVGPFNITGFEPPAGANPILYTLYFLALVVGVPFFVVSTSAPLLQRWFAYTGHSAARDPYFLYGASNLGSMLALLFYPFIVEPFLPLRAQAWTWTVGYGALALFVFACASKVWGVSAEVKPEGEPTELPPSEVPLPPPEEPSTAIKPGPPVGIARGPGKKKGPKGMPWQKPKAAAKEPEIEERRPDVMTWWRRLRWVLLSAVPSSLMLGVITYISTDLSPIPLFWVIPLALYLLTFIFVFSRYPMPWTGTRSNQTTPHLLAAYLQPFLIAALCLIMITHTVSPLLRSTSVSLLAFFCTALVCHGELARDRPSPKHLTEFYLWMSFGGMLGGMFNGLFAPLLFEGVAEYPLAIIAACFLRPKIKDDGWTDGFVENSFPGFGSWFRERGNELAKSFEKPAPRSNFLLNYSLDIVMGLFVLVLAWFLTSSAPNWGWVKILKSVGVSENLAREWAHQAARGEGVAYSLVAYVIPLIFCISFMSRPLRIGLAITAFLFVSMYLTARDEHLLWGGRSYFGVLRVLENSPAGGRDSWLNQKELVDLGVTDFSKLKKTTESGTNFFLTRYTYLMHGTTHHGLNYQEPRVLSRLATTYYHRKGPAGEVMEKLNWLPGKQNTYWADNRMPASLVGLGATIGGGVNLPMADIVGAWSEPPYATVGLGTGTMASYGRPFQHVVFYEIDETVRNFHLPAEGPFYYNYLQDALKRGSRVEVIMGDARLSMKSMQKMELSPEKKDFQPGSAYMAKGNKIVRLPEGMVARRDKYYRVIELDAFSSDAIPIHLITREAIQLYFDLLTEDGVLCVHTSNRHVDLVQPVTDIAADLKLAYRVGKGEGRESSGYLGHFGSEYVMIARKDEYLPKGEDVPLNEDWLRRLSRFEIEDARPVVSPLTNEQYMVWYTPRPPGNRIWTDNYSNLAGILRENFTVYLLLILFGVIGGFVALAYLICKAAARR